MAKETVDGAAQPKKKMSKKRKFLIALGVIAGLLVGAWVLVVTPAINKVATEQLQAAALHLAYSVVQPSRRVCGLQIRTSGSAR